MSEFVFGIGQPDVGALGKRSGATRPTSFARVVIMAQRATIMEFLADAGAGGLRKPEYHNNNALFSL